jgi:lipoprotein-releasing system ATP-binding protein
MNNEVVLKATNLAKTYYDGGLETAVFEQIDFELNAGEKVAIVGASGSGKSTLLHLLAGLEQPTSGSVVLMGQAFSSLNEKARGQLRNQHLGFVYQFHHLLPELTALENVMMPLLVRREAQREAQRRAEELLQEVGLGHRIHHKPTELSGGERQRVSIARSLITNPDVIVADEPTGNLDSQSAQAVFELLLQLNRKHRTALLIVTHDLSLASELDRQVILQQGSLS